MNQKEYHRRWYLKHREECLAYHKEYYKTHRDQIKKYYAKNRSKLSTINKQRHQNRMKVLLDNPELHEQQKAKRRTYYAANKERFHQYYENQKLKAMKGYKDDINGISRGG